MKWGINLSSPQQTPRFPNMIPTDQGRHYSADPFSGRPSSGQAGRVSPGMGSPGIQFPGQGSPGGQFRGASSAPVHGMIPTGMQAPLPGFGENQSMNRSGAPGEEF
jgi:hypothetical protein